MKETINTGIIPMDSYLSDDNPIRRATKDILLKGRTDLYTEEEVSPVVGRRYLSFGSIVSITDDEEGLLKRLMVERLLYALNNSFFSDLIRTEYYLLEIDGEMSLCTESFMDLHVGSHPGRYKFVKDDNLKPLSSLEKLEFIEDPKNLDTVLYSPPCACRITMMGYRSLDQYLFGNGRSFSEVIAEIQGDLGRKALNVMDLGGGYGLALDEAKKLHPELVTYNITRDEEFSSYPVDFTSICFVERMPAALSGKIDFIFSNMATRYFAFTDLVIRGCIESLSRGGRMHIFFSSEASGNPDIDDIKRRMKEAYQYLKDLELSGLISLQIDGTYNGLHLGEKAEEGSLFPASSVDVIKL